MDGFVGRKEELRRLEDIYSGTKFSACSVVGKRRIGKTTLIERFVEDKRHVFFEFLDGPAESNLRHMEATMSRFKKEPVAYRDFMEAFSDLDAVTSDSRTVVVFDEFPYVSGRYEPFASLVRNLIDRGSGKPFVIISGSSVKMMEAEISDGSRPLFGRTARLDVGGMSISECSEFHPGMPDADLLALYLVTSGSPFYLASTPAVSFGDYLDKYVMPRRSFFHGEGESMINRELGNPSRYVAILDALSKGRSDAKKIGDYCGIDVTTCKSCLSRLEDLGVVERVAPMAGASMKPVRYRFADGMAALHFRVFREMPGNASYESVKGSVTSVLGRLFEIFCRNLIVESYEVRTIGSWFGKVPNEDGIMEESDIDVVAEIVDGRNTVELFVECKFRSSRMGVGDLEDLNRRMDHVHGVGNRRRMLISAGGFSEALSERAEDEAVLLVGMDQIMGRSPMPRLRSRLVRGLPAGGVRGQQPLGHAGGGDELEDFVVNARGDECDEIPGYERRHQRPYPEVDDPSEAQQADGRGYRDAGEVEGRLDQPVPYLERDDDVADEQVHREEGQVASHEEGHPEEQEHMGYDDVQQVQLRRPRKPGHGRLHEVQEDPEQQSHDDRERVSGVGLPGDRQAHAYEHKLVCDVPGAEVQDREGVADCERYRRDDRDPVSALYEEADCERHQQQSAEQRELAREPDLLRHPGGLTRGRC